MAFNRRWRCVHRTSGYSDFIFCDHLRLLDKHVEEVAVNRKGAVYLGASGHGGSRVEGRSVQTGVRVRNAPSDVTLLQDAAVELLVS